MLFFLSKIIFYGSIFFIKLSSLHERVVYVSRTKMSAEQKAYQYIKHKIVTKELLPSEQIVELDICEQAHLSRTPVRSAIKRLSYEGLTVIKPNRGAFVVSPSAKEVRDVFDCKKLLETEAIRLASSRITERELKEMEKLILQEPAAYEKKDFSYFLSLNQKIHMIIASASGNTFYEKYIDELITKSNVFLIFFDDFIVTSFEDAESNREHHRILEALRDHDKERCILEMTKHSDNTFETLVVR